MENNKKILLKAIHRGDHCLVQEVMDSNYGLCFANYRVLSTISSQLTDMIERQDTSTIPLEDLVKTRDKLNMQIQSYKSMMNEYVNSIMQKGEF